MRPTLVPAVSTFNNSGGGRFAPYENARTQVLEPGRRVQAIRGAAPLRDAAAVALCSLLKVDLELLRY